MSYAVEAVVFCLGLELRLSDKVQIVGMEESDAAVVTKGWRWRDLGEAWESQLAGFGCRDELGQQQR